MGGVVRYLAFGHAAWAKAEEPVAVGKTASHVVLRSGAWTIFLGIAKEGRFPQVDSLAAAHAAATTLEIAETDAAFLARAINRLPVSETLNAPVIMDLNGKVGIRAHAEGQPTATELVLRNSQRTGDELCFATNRRYLT